MATFGDYPKEYRTSRIERRDGILQNSFHTNGDALPWGELPHREVPQAFHNIASDPDIRVGITTDTGETFSAPRATLEARLGRTAAAGGELTRKEMR